jgi:hypothetical protein
MIGNHQLTAAFSPFAPEVTADRLSGGAQEANKLSPHRLVLLEAELRELTGYKLPLKQLKALHLAGFSRARIGASGKVILERDHYLAVCAGLQASPTPRPRLRPVSRSAT